MKAPICKICINSEVLCSGCKSKLENKEIGQADIDLARALFKLSSRHPALERAEFKKTEDFKNLLLVTVPKGCAGQFIGKKGIFIKDISTMLNKKIKVIEETNDVKELIQQILFPARLLGVNVIYTQKNKETYKVRVPRVDKNKVAETEDLEEVFRLVLGGKTNIVFE